MRKKINLKLKITLKLYVGFLKKKSKSIKIFERFGYSISFSGINSANLNYQRN